VTVRGRCDYESVMSLLVKSSKARNLPVLDGVGIGWVRSSVAMEWVPRRLGGAAMGRARTDSGDMGTSSPKAGSLVEVR
jgi:hypothetical protein